MWDEIPHMSKCVHPSSTLSIVSWWTYHLVELIFSKLFTAPSQRPLWLRVMVSCLIYLPWRDVYSFSQIKTRVKIVLPSIGKYNWRLVIASKCEMRYHTCLNVSTRPPPPINRILMNLPLGRIDFFQAIYCAFPTSPLALSNGLLFDLSSVTRRLLI